jgi:hypothetical protein
VPEVRPLQVPEVRPRLVPEQGAPRPLLAPPLLEERLWQEERRQIHVAALYLLTLCLVL